ncbi:MAG: glycosyltransferase family 4 protein [Candidatus Krumholzibacteriia bacterium]
MANNHHVCFVNSLRDLGGAELWFLDAARGLRDRGIATSLIAQPGTPLLERARALALPTAAIPIRFDGAPWTLAKLGSHFRRSGVTALVCNLTKDLKAAGLAGMLAGVPVRLASRESDFPLKDKRYYRWYFQRVATGVLVNSVATRQTVLGSVPWLDPARVHLLYKGIDVERFRPRGDDLAGRAPVVGFVGQLIARKGLDCLMAAWERLDRQGGPIRPTLRLAGEGPLRPQLEAWRASLAHPARVELLGFVEDVPGFWHGCRCAVLPSLAEGFGLAAAEAAACGVPVVATQTSSLPELVHHGATGLLVPVDRPAALAAALSELLQDPVRCRTLGAAGRDLVASRFDHRRTLDQLQRLVCPEVPA